MSIKFSLLIFIYSLSWNWCNIWLNLRCRQTFKFYIVTIQCISLYEYCKSDFFHFLFSVFEQNHAYKFFQLYFQLVILQGLHCYLLGALSYLIFSWGLNLNQYRKAAEVFPSRNLTKDVQYATGHMKFWGSFLQ